MSLRTFTLSNMNLSETSWPIKIKFHQEHLWGGGLAALGFVSDQIRALVSMATDTVAPIGFIMWENLVTTVAPSF